MAERASSLFVRWLAKSLFAARPGARFDALIGALKAMPLVEPIGALKAMPLVEPIGALKATPLSALMGAPEAMPRRASLGAPLGALIGLLIAAPPLAAAPLLLEARTQEPRAYGHVIGDRIERRVVIDVPAGLALDADSLPPAGRRGRSIELAAIERGDERIAGGRRLSLTLHYQVFRSPPEPRTLELPPLMLQFRGTPRDERLRVEAWPIVVTPLAPVEVSPRRGLGELQPDRSPPPVDTAGARARLVGAGLAALVALGWLAWVYLPLARWLGRPRPFDEAWRVVSRLGEDSPPETWHAAVRALHAALDRTAGATLFEAGVPGFVAAQPRYALLQEDLGHFFAQSRALFFGGMPPSAGAAARLVAFGRRARELERGGASA